MRGKRGLLAPSRLISSSDIRLPSSLKKQPLILLSFGGDGAEEWSCGQTRLPHSTDCLLFQSDKLPPLPPARLDRLCHSCPPSLPGHCFLTRATQGFTQISWHLSSKEAYFEYVNSIISEDLSPQAAYFECVNSIVTCITF